jgi:hypothetical protein
MHSLAKGMEPRHEPDGLGLGKVNAGAIATAQATMRGAEALQKFNY